MKNNNAPHQKYFSSATLQFDLELGVVNDAFGNTQRLSPINLKLLMHLLARQSEVISRAELFDEIWPNQIVSDDVLTRAISDIRTQLAKLDADAKFIETIPKRGYRWALETHQLQNSVQQVADSDSPGIHQQIARSSQNQSAVKMLFLKAALIYVSIALMVATAIMFGLTQFMAEHVVNLAVLPVQVNRPSAEPIAKILDDALLQQLRKNTHIKLLSQSAIASRPTNPFPYFFNEFNAQWVLESRVTDLDGVEKIELSLVDARTGIELRNISFDVASRTEMLVKVAQKLETDLLAEQLPY